ncbi:hypothetical protein [Nocardia sp. NPDC052112]|uniref:hypothetical protein n=1 Tax=Nocardia sp. NPDC052112 TaxID=3155646 RepID=UPI003429C555
MSTASRSDSVRGGGRVTGGPDLEIGPLTAPRIAGNESATASTPLRRAVGRLQDVLPLGWQVEIIDAPDAPSIVDAPGRQPVVRVVMPGA